MSSKAAKNVRLALTKIFKAPSGGWRSDGHALLTQLRRCLHTYAGRLRDEEPAERTKAAVHCSAIVKIDLVLAELTGRNSSEHLLDASRLLGLAASAAEAGSVTVLEKEFTQQESRAAAAILALLARESQQRQPARINEYPPLITSLAQPLRYAQGIRIANACGPTNVRLVDTDRNKMMDMFVEAHRG